MAYPIKTTSPVLNLVHFPLLCIAEDLNEVPDIPDEHRIKQGPYSFVSWP